METTSKTTAQPSISNNTDELWEMRGGKEEEEGRGRGREGKRRSEKERERTFEDIFSSNKKRKKLLKNNVTNQNENA